LEIKKNWNFHW